MKKYLIISVIIYFAIGFGLDILNYLNWSTELPKEIAQIYNEKEYVSATKYAIERFGLNMWASILFGIIFLFSIYFDLFKKLDKIITKKIKNTIILGVVFFLILNIIYQIIDLPFSYYYHFVIEENFGFNKMNLSLFFMDSLKGLLISSIFLSFYVGIMINFTIKQNKEKKKKVKRKQVFYLYGILVSFMTFMTIFGSTIFIPLFNDLKPIKNIELKNEISKIAKKEKINLEGIYIIDGSKRSTKANAFVTGFGPTKKIVLYDTLIKDFTTEEVLAILYHEIGHYKLNHIIYDLLIGIFILTVFFGIGLLNEDNKNDWITGKIFFKNRSIHLGVLYMFIISLPFFLVFPIIRNSISRTFEYQADNYSIQNYGPEANKSALIKLSKTTKSNVSPHPLYEIFYYSHPSILKRLENIDNFIKNK